MNHVSLALKYRPMRFGDLVGQEHVTGPLAQAVLVGRIAPAYLFSGSRGSGKTTTARILAKALNCTHRQGAEPCNECPSCVAITNGSSLDVIEIDGASNRGIDDIRDIRERVRYAPTGGGKKVYIVDEVHMLTDQAFNAFLKTLEEPPPHVVFVFATTDPDDLLETVRSRCQRYDFQRIGVKQAFERLKWIAGREKLDTEEAALHFLARRSEGSLRDALVLLDQAVNSGEKRITEAGLCSLMGHADTEFFFRLTDAVLARDAQAALKLLAEALSRRTRETLVFAGLCEHFRALMLARVSPSLDGLLEGTPEMLARYLEAAQRFPEEDLVQCLDLCLDGASRLERSPHPRFQLELLVVTLARLDSVKSLEQILARLESGGPMPAPRGAGSAPPAASPRGAAAPGGAGVSAASPGAGSAAPLPRPAAPSLAGAVSAGAPLPPSAAAAARRAAGVPEPSVPLASLAAFPEESWTRVLAHVGESRRTLGAILEVAQPLGCDGETLYVAVTSDFQRLQLESRDHVRFVEGALADLGLPARRFRCVARPGQAAGASPAAARPAAAPLRDSARPNVAAADAPLPAAAPRPAAAVPSADPAAPPVDLVEKVIEMFGGEVVG